MKHKVDQLTHQKWSGAEYIDNKVTMIATDTKTTASGGESTEGQFTAKPKL